MIGSVLKCGSIFDFHSLKMALGDFQMMWNEMIIFISIFLDNNILCACVCVCVYAYVMYITHNFFCLVHALTNFLSVEGYNYLIY